MFDHTHPETSTDPVMPLREFTALHREALINAAGLLGGCQGIRLALDALDCLASEDVLSRRARNRFAALLDLLALEHVHDEHREKSARFAAIDPTDPVVEEICALTDELRDTFERATMDHRPASHRAAA